jgi:predicted ATP-dependent protease
MRLVLIPKENEREVERAFGPLAIEPVATIDEALAALGVTRKAKR